VLETELEQEQRRITEEEEQLKEEKLETATHVEGNELEKKLGLWIRQELEKEAQQELEKAAQQELEEAAQQELAAENTAGKGESDELKQRLERAMRKKLEQEVASNELEQRLERAMHKKLELEMQPEKLEEQLKKAMRQKLLATVEGDIKRCEEAKTKLEAIQDATDGGNKDSAVEKLKELESI